MSKLNRSENVTKDSLIARLRETAIQQFEVAELAVELLHRPVRNLQAYGDTPAAFQMKDTPNLINMDRANQVTEFHVKSIALLAQAYGLKFNDDAELARAALQRGYVLVPKAVAEKMTVLN